MNGVLPGFSRAFSGRLALILITVTAAAGGFTLGFFVGKTDSPPPAIQPVLPVPSVSESPPPQTETSPPESASGAPAPGENRAGALPQQAVTSSAVPAAGSSENRQASGAGSAITAQGTEKRADAPAPAQLQEPKTANASGSEPLFTVQAGAFKSEKEAARLADRLEKKGYEPQSVRAVLKKSKVIKVTVGSFPDKKEADALARELNKEGIKAFTIRKKQ